MMEFNTKFSSPVLFDANILIFSCENKVINNWINYFENPLIHREVYEEIEKPTTKKTIDDLITKGILIIVEEPIYEDLDTIQKALYDSCKNELSDRLDIRNGNDLGEYKTLIYSKLYNIPVISTQDTTVWSLYIHSKNFKGNEFITIQDISYMMSQNGETKIGRSIYKSTTNVTKYPRDEFFNHAKSKNTKQEFNPSFLSFKFTKD